MLFKKIPVQVEAFKWTADHDQTENPEWIVAAIKDGRVWFGRDSLNNVTMIISTLEGNMTATPGDWIIKGVADEIYPCKPEIFERTYRASTPVNFERPAGDIVVALRQEDATNNQSLLDEAGRLAVADAEAERTACPDCQTLQAENERLRGIIRRMQSACGLPDAANACRVVLEIAREADRA